MILTEIEDIYPTFYQVRFDFFVGSQAWTEFYPQSLGKKY